MFVQGFLLALALPFTQVTAETVLGAYVLHRHGDRTPKSLPPVSLTSLGYAEVYASGQWFRQRYLTPTSPTYISGISANTVVQSQITVSAADDVTLMSSAQGFLQGLYPPAGAASSQKLRNGSTVEAPMGGYQLIPIHTVTAGTGSESAGWLQGSTGCAKAMTSSSQYFNSPEYMTLLNSTNGFYQNLVPVVNGTFAASATNFKNAYTIYDLLNVAEIHNATLNTDILTPDVFNQTRTLADNHEYNLAYNASSPIRAIAGATLAAQILQALNTTVVGGGNGGMLGVQFGAYASFFSFFGLAKLPSVNTDFMGIPDYASFMAFELVTNASTTPTFPAASDISVRFLFHNGTVSNTSQPAVFPLFGGQQTEVAWSSFVSSMNEFAIGNQDAWCSACGNTTGSCASSSASSSSSSQKSGSGGISKAVAGVIGAFVALAVILALEALIMLIAGLRLTKKGSRRNGAGLVRGEKEGSIESGSAYK